MLSAACRKAFRESPKNRPDSNPKAAPEAARGIGDSLDGHVRIARPNVVMATPSHAVALNRS